MAAGWSPHRLLGLVVSWWRTLVGKVAVGAPFASASPRRGAGSRAPPRNAGSVFRPSADPVVGTTIAPTEAPPRPVSWRSLQPAEPGSDIEVAIRRLKRAAVVDVFGQLGLDYVPPNVWIFTDPAEDLGDSIEKFFKATGCDPLRLRRRNPAERRKANLLLSLLVDIRDAFARLDPDVVDRIAARLHSGDFESVRTAARAVSTMETIYRAGHVWTDDERLQLFREFLAQVEAGMIDPLSLTIDDIAEAEALFADLRVFQSSFDTERKVHRDLLAQLTHSWPSRWATGPKADALHTITAEFEALVAILQSTEGASVANVKGAVDRLDTLNGQLEALLREADGYGRRRSGSSGSSGGTKSRRSGGSGGSRGKSSGRGRSTPPPKDDKVAAGKAFFGFAPHSNPTQAELKKAYRSFLMKNHPDHAIGDQAETIRRNEACKKANGHKTALGL